MRILVVNNFFPPRVGGSSHLSDALAKGYAARGHEVMVVTAAFGDAPAEECRDGLRIVRVPAVMLPESRFAVSFDISFATRPTLQRQLGRLFDEFQPDLVHQHGQFMDLTWATGAQARRRGIPVVLSVHTRLENPSALYRNAFRTLDATLVAPRLRRTKPAIVVMDVLMDEYIRDRYRRGTSRLVPIPVGVDGEWVRGGDAQRGRELMGVDADTPLILSIGHVIPLRDRIGLVEALPAVLAEHPNARLAVIGRVYYDRFLQRAKELGVEHAVLAPGAMPKSAIPDLLAAATVESHEQGDGLGTATLEAMAAGVPVVGWGRHDNFPGVPLVEGEDIFLTARGDVPGLAERLNKVLADPDLAARMSTRAREVFDANFTLARVLDQHLELFSELVPTPHHPSRHTEELT